jgi:hypothetical protein
MPSLIYDFDVVQAIETILELVCGKSVFCCRGNDPWISRLFIVSPEMPLQGAPRRRIRYVAVDQNPPTEAHVSDGNDGQSVMIMAG